MNPLQKARDGTASAWRKSLDGAKRTAGWVKGGVTGIFFGKPRSGAANLGGGSSQRTPAARGGIAGARDRIGGASLMQRARADNRIGAGLILGALLLITWIAWTVYVWTENGSSAGLGVLISWPAAIAAFALIAVLFVGAVMLVRRLTADREPALAGGAVPAAAEVEQRSDASGSGDDENADADEDQPEDDSEDEQDDAESEEEIAEDEDEDGSEEDDDSDEEDEAA